MTRPVTTFLAIFFMGSALLCRAQEEMGTLIDNYTPVNTMLLHPSLIADQRPWLDIHVVGFGFYLRSNVMYFPNARLTQPSTLTQRAYRFDRNRNWMQVSTQLLGPSASLSLGKHAFGIHTAIRANANANRVPTPTIRALDGQNVDNELGFFDVKRGRIKGMGWAELGLSYATIAYQFDRDLITVGGTLKRYWGLGYGGLVLNEAGLDVSDTSSAYVYARGVAAAAPIAWNAGGGWGMSLGITYKKMHDDVTHYIPHGRAERCVTKPYRYKISLSVTDIGYIRFKKDAFVNRFDEAEEAQTLQDDLTFTGYANPSEANRTGDRFTATTPMAVSLLFDYNYSRGVYFNAVWVQRIARPGGLWSERANLLAVTPRFERAFFSAGMPISLVNYSMPQLGFFFRVSGLTIGTENLSSYILRRDMYAADIYFHFRIPFNRSRKCKTVNNNAGPGFRFRDLFKWHDPTIEDCPEW